MCRDGKFETSHLRPPSNRRPSCFRFTPSMEGCQTHDPDHDLQLPTPGTYKFIIPPTTAPSTSRWTAGCPRGTLAPPTTGNLQAQPAPLRRSHWGIRRKKPHRTRPHLPATGWTVVDDSMRPLFDCATTSNFNTGRDTAPGRVSPTRRR